MKSPKNKKDLIEKAVRQIEVDVHCGDVEAIEELLTFCPVENVIAYLPEEDWKPFTHLVAEDYLKKEKSFEIKDLEPELIVKGIIDFLEYEEALTKDKETADKIRTLLINLGIWS